METIWRISVILCNWILLLFLAIVAKSSGVLMFYALCMGLSTLMGYMTTTYEDLHNEGTLGYIYIASVRSFIIFVVLVLIAYII